MPTRLLIALAATLATWMIPAAAQSDLDAFMRQVLTRRDDNWKKLQQYTLEEDEVFQLSAVNGRKLYGFKREYTWFPSTPPTSSPAALRTGPSTPPGSPASLGTGPSTPPAEDVIFIRSPISADGVKLSEVERREAEARWIRDERGREQARQKREEERARRASGSDASGTDADATGDTPGAGDDSDAGDTPPSLDDLVKPANEPRFVSSAYFMKFKFDEGTYAFAGREKLLGRDVLKIEYYPRYFFRDRSRKAPAATDAGTSRAKRNDVGDKIDRKMDKVSMITLWIEPADHQILQYEFTNIDFDFLPGRQLVQLDDLRASMRMREAFPNVWLPDTINMAFGLTSALGDIAARYEVKYHDYKLAEVKARVR